MSHCINFLKLYFSFPFLALFLPWQLRSEVQIIYFLQDSHNSKRYFLLNQVFLQTLERNFNCTSSYSQDYPRSHHIPGAGSFSLIRSVLYQVPRNSVTNNSSCQSCSLILWPHFQIIIHWLFLLAARAFLKLYLIYFPLFSTKRSAIQILPKKYFDNKKTKWGVKNEVVETGGDQMKFKSCN